MDYQKVGYNITRIVEGCQILKTVTVYGQKQEKTFSVSQFFLSIPVPTCKPTLLLCCHAVADD